MKPQIPIILVLAFVLCGCDTIDLQRGTIVGWGDSTNVTMTYHGATYHHDTLSHSAVWDASGRFVGNVGSGVATALLAGGAASAIKGGSTSGVQLLGAMPAIVHPIVNRRTNRATPIPKVFGTP